MVWLGALLEEWGCLDRATAVIETKTGECTLQRWPTTRRSSEGAGVLKRFSRAASGLTGWVGKRFSRRVWCPREDSNLHDLAITSS